jgi:hypothetical protein
MTYYERTLVDADLDVWKSWAKRFSEDAALLVAIFGEDSHTAIVALKDLKEYKRFLESCGLTWELGNIVE